MAYWLAWAEPRAVEGLAHVVKFFVRNLGGLTRARTSAGPAREGRSRTPSMYADEKSDEVVVPRKRPNKGRQLPAEVVAGRGLTRGEQPTGGRGSDTEPRCHVDPIGGCAPELMQFQNHVPPTFDPREEILCRCGGRGDTGSV